MLLKLAVAQHFLPFYQILLHFSIFFGKIFSEFFLSTILVITGRLVLKKTVFCAWASKLNMGLINKG